LDLDRRHVGHQRGKLPDSWGQPEVGNFAV
jgi:hypothetical protein